MILAFKLIAVLLLIFCLTMLSRRFGPAVDRGSRKLDEAQRHETAKRVITGRKTGAEMARISNVNQPTVSRIVAQHRTGQP